MEFKKKRKKDIHIDITPLVDTVFILLIFFALSLNFTKNTALDIELPEITSKKPYSQDNKIIINITKDEIIYLNDKPVDNINNLKKMLSKLQTLKKHGLIIEADINVRHGKIVEIMDICKTSGINNIAIAAHIK
jgi:biopolymer transport protein ExbD